MVGKDALTETTNVLKGLAGFLRAVQTTPDDNLGPSLRTAASKLEDLAIEIESLATSKRPRHCNPPIEIRKQGNLYTLVG